MADEARATLLTVEALGSPGSAQTDARATLLTVEALGSPGSAQTDARATLLTAEALGSPSVVAAQANFSVEVLMSTAPAITTAQIGPLSVETLGVDPSAAWVQQLTVEVIGPNTVVERVEPETGASVWTGQTPTLTLTRPLTPGAGALVWTGQTPAWAQRQTLEPGAGQIIWTGQTPVCGMVTTLPAPLPQGDQRFVVPAGKLFFAPCPGVAEHYFGETPGAELAIELKTIEVYGADAAVSELIAEIPYSVVRELSFKCINPSDEVVGWFFGADHATLSQSLGSVSNETLAAVTPVAYYQLGRSATNPTGARDITGVVVTDDAGTPVTFDLTDDYTVDLALGRLYIVPGGAITAGTNLRVDYATTARTRTQHTATPDLATRLTGALRFIANNTSGANRDLYAPKCVLRADGSVQIKRAQQDGKITEFGFKARFQKSDALAAVYIDGRAVA